MKIMFTMTPGFNPNAGGVQRSTYKLGKFFTEKGFDVGYYSLSDQGHVDSEYGKLFYAPHKNRNKNPKNIQDLERVIKSWRPNIIINQMPYENELSALLFKCKKEAGYILLGCLRNSLFNFKSNARDRMRTNFPGPVFKLLDNPIGIGLIQKRHWLKHRKDLKKIIDRHDRFILLAPPNKIELEHFVGNYKDEKIVSIPNSIPAVYDDIESKEKIILHVGRIDVAQKRSDLLIDFWKNVHKELPDWHFVIVGDGNYMTALKANLKNSKLPRIKLEGHQKPEGYYKKASIFMMPSAYEGFPNTLIEAQSYGCVCLAFNNYAALSWIVNHKKDSILCEPFNVKEMADNVIELAKDDDKRKKMKEASLDNARRFLIEEVGKQWLKLFEELS